MLLLQIGFLVSLWQFRQHPVLRRRVYCIVSRDSRRKYFRYKHHVGLRAIRFGLVADWELLSPALVYVNLLAVVVLE